MNILNLLAKLVTNPSTRSPLLAFGLAAITAMATAAESPPELMTVQSYITDDAGDPLGVGTPLNKPMQFIIYTAEEGGESVFAESQTVTVDNGYFSAILGEGTALDGDAKHNLATAFTGSTASDRYVEIQVDNSGTLQTLSPRLRILPTAYSFLASYANVAGSVDNLAIDTAALDDGAVNSAKVLDNSLTASDLATNSVGASEIATGAVGSSEVADNSLTASDLATNSVGSAEIATGAVHSSEVADGSLTAADLAADSVNYSEIAEGAVRSSEVLNNSLTSADLAPNSVYASEIATDAVGSSEIAAGAVGTSEVSNNSLTSSDLAADSVGNSELAGDLTLTGRNGVNYRHSDTTFAIRMSLGDVYPLWIENSNGTDLFWVNVAGQAIAQGGVFVLSDRRYKNNIKPVDSFLEGVLELEPVTYQLVESIDQSEQLGLIAQDAQEVFPMIVVEIGDEEEHLAIDYDRLAVVAIGAIKELDEKLEAVVSENASLDQKNAELEDRLIALEALVESLAK